MLSRIVNWYWERQRIRNEKLMVARWKEQEGTPESQEAIYRREIARDSHAIAHIREAFSQWPEGPVKQYLTRVVDNVEADLFCERLEEIVDELTQMNDEMVGHLSSNIRP